MKLKHILQQIKHTIKWLPVIWNDRDFDYEYLLDIMRFKLENMQTFFESDDTSVESALLTAQQIKQALKVIDRYFNESYYSVEFAEFDIKHGLSDGDDFFVLNDKFRMLSDVEKSEWFGICVKADAAKHNDLMLFFNLIGDNIEGWWD